MATYVGVTNMCDWLVASSKSGKLPNFYAMQLVAVADIGSKLIWIV